MTKPWSTIETKMSPKDRAEVEKETQRLMVEIDKRTEIGNQIKKLLVPVIINLHKEGWSDDDIRRTIIEMILPKIQTEKEYNKKVALLEDISFGNVAMIDESCPVFEQILTEVLEYEDFHVPELEKLKEEV